MCRKPKGCPIEDVASDFQLNQFISRYVMARNIYERNKITDLLVRELEKLGLIEDYDLFSRLEVIYLTARANKNKEPEIVQTWKRR